MHEGLACIQMYEKGKGRSTEITVNLHETNHWDKNIPNMTQYSSLVGFLPGKSHSFGY
jgi:hypothetical protein